MRGTGDSVGKRNVQKRTNKREEEGHKHIGMETYLGQTALLENVKETQELIRVICKHKTLQGNGSIPRLSGWIWAPVFFSVYVRELLLSVYRLLMSPCSEART